MPPLDADVAMYLMEKYPGLRREGLHSMWFSAWAWVEERVPPQRMKQGSIPRAFEFAAIHRVHSFCTHSPQERAAFLYVAVELLSPYMATH